MLLMRVQFFILACLIGFSCSRCPPKIQNKGIIEWFQSLFGGITFIPSTSTSISTSPSPSTSTSTATSITTYASTTTTTTTSTSTSTSISTSTMTSKPMQNPPNNCPACQCGIVRKRKQTMSGGKFKNFYIPWALMMRYKNKYHCDVSLINDRYVLTAAHCISGIQPKDVIVQFFEYDGSKLDQTTTSSQNVAAVIPHERYNPATHDNDIGLLKLENPVDLRNTRSFLQIDEEANTKLDNERAKLGILRLPRSSNRKDDNDILPVCLATGGLSYINYVGVVAHWSTTDEISATGTLDEQDASVLSNKECRLTYSDRLTQNMLCVEYNIGARKTCKENSGWPLYIKNATTEKYQEVGIASWAEGCARSSQPSVYTRVNRYLSWIRINTRDACYCQ